MQYNSIWLWKNFDDFFYIKTLKIIKQFLLMKLLYKNIGELLRKHRKC